MERTKRADILLVEDSLEDSELALYSILKENDNLKMKHFTNGEEALRFVMEEKNYWGQRMSDFLKLIIVDLNLPKLSGLEMVGMLRSNEETRSIPIVILSASTSKKDIQYAYGLGVNSYVVKPTEFEGYLKKIGALATYWSKINERPS